MITFVFSRFVHITAASARDLMATVVCRRLVSCAVVVGGLVARQRVPSDKKDLRILRPKPTLRLNLFLLWFTLGTT